MIVRPGVSELNCPCHVTGLMTPGKATGTWNARPSRKALPPSPVGTVVSQVFVAVLEGRRGDARVRGEGDVGVRHAQRVGGRAVGGLDRRVREMDVLRVAAEPPR